MIALIRFELGDYLKRPGIYVIFFLLTALGLVIGCKLSFSPSTEIYRNAPYTITNMVGLLSLTAIFMATILASQIHFKEQDSGFRLILYATPITKAQYLVSRFAAQLLLTVICFLLLIAGYILGHLADDDRTAYQEFQLWFYLQPVLVLALPNILLCTVLMSTSAWISKNKMIVYLTGLFLYVIYLVALTYSGSPMMAGSLPQSPELLRFAAKADPFGLSAFYQQTNLWTAEQKNTLPINLTGNFLLNREIYIGIAAALLIIVYFKFKLSISDFNQPERNGYKQDKDSIKLKLRYSALQVNPNGFRYELSVLRSQLSMEMKVVVKSIPFVLIALGLIFYLGMEFYGSIDQGIRVPEQYATTALMVNRIIFNLPGLLLLISLFYAHELYWRSADSHFNLIVDSTPASESTQLLAKLFTISCVIVLLTTVVILTGITFQLIYQYPIIDWTVYAAIYWLIDVPLIISTALILLLQYWVGNKWAGLFITCISMLVLTTSAGKAIGMTHPLIRFGAAYTAKYSEMNGWEDYFRTFSWKTVYGVAMVTLMWVATSVKSSSNITFRRWYLIFPLIGCIFSGIYIFRQTPWMKTGHELDTQQAYEQLYRKFKLLDQPELVSVTTEIDLFPDRHTYQIRGKYLLRNNGTKPIDTLLVNFDNHLSIGKVTYLHSGHQESVRATTGFVRLKKPLMPGDSAQFSFSFHYQWSGFTGHQSFNAIVKNGTFLRISNYFPRFGYQTDQEISSLSERRTRHLGVQTPLIKFDAPRGKNKLINLDMTISVPSGQSAVGVGELAREWKLNGRNYFLYRSGRQIPFRFGISAARYQKKVITHHGVNIEVYYDSRHFENVNHLIKNACTTMDYCQSNFGPYPFKTIRFAEVSSFTDGFAGTAYPATIFMTEHMLFHNNLSHDRRQDVINELAAHELSHQWWGTAQLAPDEREGSKILTETLAMYTELVLAQHNLDENAVKEKLAVHEGIYLNERGFNKESSLLKVKPEDIHLYYSKGLLAMFKLERLIGEKNINKALRNLLKKHTYPLPPPVPGDLLEELYLVSKPSAHTGIKDLFMKTE
jgi:ABC-2 type transport system permease protein